MSKKFRLSGLLIVIPIFAFIMYGQLKSCRYEKQLDSKGIITIGKIDSIQILPKRSYIYLSYYIHGKKYSSFESGLQKSISKKDIGKFYKVKYLEISPEIIRGIYSEQITDTLSILNAGFNIQ
jgi:hypothetical protein